MNARDESLNARRVFLSPRLARSDLSLRLQREMQGDVLFDAASRGRYSTDASIYQVQPIGVAVPKTEADLAIALDAARDLKVAILPRGGGTSQCGQTVGEALVIDHSKWLNQVVEFDAEQARRDPANATVTVQPGMVLDRLNAFLLGQGDGKGARLVVALELRSDPTDLRAQLALVPSQPEPQCAPKQDDHRAAGGPLGYRAC
jgi:FAD/FMN-containing dehydrogenase